jgi:hypothetical protein
MHRSTRTLLVVALTIFLGPNVPNSPLFGQLRVGASITDVTPTVLPVLVNGGMVARSISAVHSRLNARAIVIESGDSRIALVVVDSCMIPRPLCDEAKQLASLRTKLRPDQIMISATHSHTAPSSMGCLGTAADPTYVPYLREKIAEAIASAEKNLEPAEVGWGSTAAADLTALRRWVRRSDRVALDPFGNPTVRANMHSANNWDDVTGESGPEDPELSMISFRAKTGRPIALIANFSMHYFGSKDLSADYFGLFSDGIAERIGPADKDAPSFVGILSHGCSGDIWRRDYAVPADQRANPTIDSYTTELLDIAVKAYHTIAYQETTEVAIAERRLQLNYRVPNQQLLEWSQKAVAALEGASATKQPDVYAQEQIILHERQATEVVVQAMRIGDIAIATTPNETYALTGLKLKLQSPFAHTMVIELANGGDGYIPPPEQHILGGYNTWAARSAGLEVQAEPKIVEAGLQLLEQAAGLPRRELAPPSNASSKAVMNLEPQAFWQLDEMAGPIAADSSSFGRNASYEDGVVFFLPGAPTTDAPFPDNHAAHFAGGRVRSRFAKLADEYSISLWCWNGMPLDARETTGWLFSRDHQHGTSTTGDHLGLSGGENAGQIVFQHGAGPLTGKTKLKRWTWYHIVMVRSGIEVAIYVDGELDLRDHINGGSTARDLFVGGRSDNQFNWEGRIDEVAVFGRTLTPDEVKSLYVK